MSNSFWQFIVGILGIATVGLLVAFKGNLVKGIKHLKNNEGVAAGWGLAIGFSLVAAIALSLLSNKAEAMPQTKYGHNQYFAYTEVFAGLDHTKKQSPMCDPGSPDDRLTSHLGVKQNIYMSYDESFDLSAKYVHHSCAVNEDWLQYDAYGLEASYRFWW